MSNSLMVKSALLVIATANYLTACGVDKEPEIDVPLSKQPFTWPIQGGLDTKRAPLSVAPGSNLLVQDVREERLGEWRRRDGFSQSELDTLPELAPYFVGRLGDSGLFENGQAGLSAYAPSVTPKWGTPAISAPPQHRTRKPLFESSGNELGFARAGNVVAVGSAIVNAGGGSSALTVRSVDVASGAVIGTATRTLGPSVVRGRIRGAATASKLVIAVIDNDGSAFGTIGVWAYVIAAAPGGIAAPVLVMAIATSVVSLDVTSYGGATITLAIIQNALTVRHIEYNPSTGALATDVVLAGVANSVAISLLQDPDASGVRAFVHTMNTNAVRVVRFSSAGAVLTDDLAEALGALAFSATGILSAGGANWNIVYDVIGNTIRIQNKTGGVVGTASNFQGATTWSGTFIAAQAWRDPNVSGWSFLLGTAPSGSTDPQNCYTEMLMPLGTGTVGIPVSSPVQMAASSTSSYSPFQVVRTAAYKFSTVLPVQVVYENNAGTIVRHYSLDLFEQTYLTNADNAANVTSQPVQWRSSALVPAGQLSFYDGGTLKPLGTRVPPRQVAVTPSTGAGALTLLKQYGYIWVIEQIDADGNTWRSPPSVPLLLTLTGTQNTNTVTMSSWALEPATQYRASLYRTSGNTSLYRRIYSTLFLAGPDVVYVDLIADTAQGAGEALYTTGEIPNILTPPASMVALALDRAWIVNREYPTELSYSKQLRPGRLPEFNDEMLHDLDDEYGDLTAIAGCDDKVVAFKESAVYTVAGQGLDDSGAGQGYTVTRIATDMGAIIGSPVLSLGNEVFFVSKRGISSVNAAGGVAFIGSPVDLYLNQPQLATRETVRAIVYSRKWNEVRFVTNASVLVYNRTFEIWSRWVGGLATGSPLAHSLMVGDTQYIFREDGKVFVEGGTSQFTDGATAFPGYVRSPYMVPAGSDGRLRLYSGRAKAVRTAGGSPILPVFSLSFDYDDATQIDFDPPSPIPGAELTVNLEAKPHVTRQTCTAFAEQITFPAGDNTWRIQRWGAVIGIEPGYSRNAQKWSE